MTTWKTVFTGVVDGRTVCTEIDGVGNLRVTTTARSMVEIAWSARTANRVSLGEVGDEPTIEIQAGTPDELELSLVFEGGFNKREARDLAARLR